MVPFRKGQRKDDVAAEQRKAFEDDGRGGVHRQGTGEDAGVSHRASGATRKTGGTYPWIVRSTAMVNQFYIYCVDRDFGPFFLKFSTYFPYNAKLCLNGHEYVKRQLAKGDRLRGARQRHSDLCRSPARLQSDLRRALRRQKIDALLRKWLRRLPHPFTAAGSRGRLPLRHLHPAGGVLADPGSGPARARPRSSSRKSSARTSTSVVPTRCN